MLTEMRLVYVEPKEIHVHLAYIGLPAARAVERLIDEPSAVEKIPVILDNTPSGRQVFLSKRGHQAGGVAPICEFNGVQAARVKHR
jgi:hypothetical protein